MSRLRNRVEVLEQRQGGITRWHAITQKVGQTQEEAQTLYENENGAIGPDEGIILHRIVKPGGVPCLA